MGWGFLGGGGGGGLTNVDNWTAEGGTAAPNLSKYDGALRGYWALDDAVGTVGTAKRLGLGPALIPGGSASFGNTAIIGTGTSLSFAADTDWLRSAMPGPKRTSAGLAKWTISFWFKSSAAEPSVAAFWPCFQDQTSTNRMGLLWKNSGHKFYALQGNTEYDLWSPSGGWASDVADGSAHHIAWTYGGKDSNTFKLWFDNVVVGASSAVNITVDPGAVPFQVGDSSAARAALGSYSHLAYWNDELSSAAMNELINGGAGRFLQPIA